jgi:hypothetical protein
LLGAEAVLLTEAAFKLKPAWAYLVGGGAGAVAGGVGGYFVEQTGSARASIFLLAGGMALAIPTTVAVLSASAYEPPADYVQDTGPVDEPIADPAQPAGLGPAPEAEPPGPTSRAKAPAGRVARNRSKPSPPELGVHAEPERALMAWNGSGSLTLNVPAIALYDIYTSEQMLRFGMEQETELRIPVLELHF